MIGDKLVITAYHRRAAGQVMPPLQKLLDGSQKPLAVTIAGESGSGKSEIALCLAELVHTMNRKCLILALDDYFILPPKSNHEKRLQDIGRVGTGEVRLDLLDAHILHFKTNPDEPLCKPLVHFKNNRIDEETVPKDRYDVIIAEGTYTSLLTHADFRVFIDRTYKQTKMARLTRNRDPDIDFLEKVLEIEHREISSHKAKADIVIAPPPEERYT
jgi:uridine kinase